MAYFSKGSFQSIFILLILMREKAIEEEKKYTALTVPACLLTARLFVLISIFFNVYTINLCI